MKMRSAITIAIASVTLLGYLLASAAEPGQKAPTEILVEFGTNNGDLVITPRELEFKTGEYYKLVIHNPSSVNHYLSTPGFGAIVRTSKVETIGAAVRATHVNPRARAALGSRMVSSYHVKEIALRPGGTAEWYLTPAIPGQYDFSCGIPGHKKAGMTSRVMVN